MKEEVISKVVYMISSVVNTDVALVGSVGIGIDISSSDLDLAISAEDMGTAERFRIILQNNGFEFRGERPSTYTTTRYLLSKQLSECFVDVIILLNNDFNILVKGISNANLSLSSSQKMQICEEKRRLKAISYSKYEEYKLLIYKRYCPGLLWLTDIDICKMMLKRIKETQAQLPSWLREKVEEYNLED